MRTNTIFENNASPYILNTDHYSTFSKCSYLHLPASAPPSPTNVSFSPPGHRKEQGNKITKMCSPLMDIRTLNLLTNVVR